MKRLTIILALTLTFAAAGQNYIPPRGSPDEVLDQYFKMINDGTLLTSEGWKRAAVLFVHPSPAPREVTIFVTTKYPLGNGPMSIKGNRAEAWQKWVDDLGTIDPALRYKPAPTTPQGVLTIRIYRLIFTDKHWEIGSDGKSEEEVTGPSQWRIEGSLDVRSASRGAAIGYLKRMRDRATDPTLVENANKALATLRR